MLRTNYNLSFNPCPEFCVWGVAGFEWSLLRTVGMAICISHCIHFCNQVPDKYLKQRSVYFGSQLKGLLHNGCKATCTHLQGARSRNRTEKEYRLQDLSPRDLLLPASSTSQSFYRVPSVPSGDDQENKLTCIRQPNDNSTLLLIPLCAWPFRIF